MKYILSFLLFLGLWLVVFLAVDLHANTTRMFEKAGILALVSVVLWTLLFKPLRRWYWRNFSKAYKYNKQKPIQRDKLTDPEKK